MSKNKVYFFYRVGSLGIGNEYIKIPYPFKTANIVEALKKEARKYIRTMKIPKNKRKLTKENILWLDSNLIKKNIGHKHYPKAFFYIRTLTKRFFKQEPLMNNWLLNVYGKNTTNPKEQRLILNRTEGEAENEASSAVDNKVFGYVSDWTMTEIENDEELNQLKNIEKIEEL